MVHNADRSLSMKALLAVTQPSCTPLQNRLCSGTLRFALQAYLAWPAFLYAACCLKAPSASLAPLACSFMLTAFFCRQITAQQTECFRQYLAPLCEA